MQRNYSPIKNWCKDTCWSWLFYWVFDFGILKSWVFSFLKPEIIRTRVLGYMQTSLLSQMNPRGWNLIFDTPCTRLLNHLKLCSEGDSTQILLKFCGINDTFCRIFCNNVQFYKQLICTPNIFSLKVYHLGVVGECDECGVQRSRVLIRSRHLFFSTFISKNFKCLTSILQILKSGVI